MYYNAVHKSSFHSNTQTEQNYSGTENRLDTEDKGSAENVTARKQIIVRNSPEEHKWFDF